MLWPPARTAARIAMTERKADVRRKTRETAVRAAVNLDGRGRASLRVGLPFLEHMLEQVARHGLFDLTLEAEGDLAVDAHHTVEDVGIVLGHALAEALGQKRGIRRYGDALVPMDEALAQVALDISGRTLLAFDADLEAAPIGSYPPLLTREFLHSLCRSAGLTLHVRLLAGVDARRGAGFRRS
jgi:imidazoleglycerol-phosphate dehydratase